MTSQDQDGKQPQAGESTAADQAALKKLGDEFRPGMVFAFNIDLFDPKFHDGKTGCVFAETVVITDTGAKRLHSYPMNFQIIA